MTHSKDLKTALEAGAIDYIRKPIDEVELTARINSMLMLAESNKALIDLKNRQLASVALSINRKNRLILHVINKLNSIKSRLADDERRLKNELFF